MESKLYPREIFDFEKRPLSYSRLKNILQSPLHFAHDWTHKKAPTEAMTFGNVLDCLLFTPDDFKKMFLVTPKFERRSNADKERWKNLVKQAQDEKKILIFDEMIPRVEEMKKTLMKSIRFKRLYEATTSVQCTYTFVDKKTGFKVIGKFDATAEIEGKSIIWDLKSTTDASKEDYPKQAINMDYPLQGGTYLTAYLHNTGKFADFYHVVIETGDVCGVNVFRAPNDWIEKGKEDLRTALDRVKFCYDNDCFDLGYEFLNVIENIVMYDTLNLPNWAKNK